MGHKRRREVEPARTPTPHQWGGARKRRAARHISVWALLSTKNVMDTCAAHAVGNGTDVKSTCWGQRCDAKVEAVAPRVRVCGHAWHAQEI